MGVVTGGVGTTCCGGGGVTIGVADLGSDMGVALGVADFRNDSCLLDGGGGCAEGGGVATSGSGVGEDQHCRGVGRLSLGGGLYFMFIGTLLARSVSGWCWLARDIDVAGRCDDAWLGGLVFFCSGGVIGGW